MRKTPIMLAKQAFVTMKSVLCDINMSFPLRYRVLCCYVFQSFQYGSESWMLTKADAAKVEAAEMWLLRRMEIENQNNEHGGPQKDDRTQNVTSMARESTSEVLRTCNEKRRATTSRDDRKTHWEPNSWEAETNFEPNPKMDGLRFNARSF